MGVGTGAANSDDDQRGILSVDCANGMPARVFEPAFHC